MRPLIDHLYTRTRSALEKNNLTLAEAFAMPAEELLLYRGIGKAMVREIHDLRDEMRDNLALRQDDVPEPPAPSFTMHDAAMHREYAAQARATAQQGRKHFATPARRAALRRTIEVAEWHESMAERIEAWIHLNV